MVVFLFQKVKKIPENEKKNLVNATSFLSDRLKLMNCPNTFAKEQQQVKIIY